MSSAILARPSLFHRPVAAGETFWGPGDMYRFLVMADLIAGALAAADAPASFLLPTRQHELFRSLLGLGLRVVKPMNYMAVGEHRQPRGAWIPSVLY